MEKIKGISTFAATIVGAGILALPVYLSQAGFLPGMIMIVLIGTISIFSAFFIIETFLRSEENLHLPALAGKYLGKVGLFLMFLGILIYIYGALTGYLSAGGQVMHEISQGKIPLQIGTLIYFLLGAAIIYLGLRAVKTASFLLFPLMIILFLFLTSLAFFHLDLSLLDSARWQVMPLTFGILLFAFTGHTVLPSLAKTMRRDPAGLRKVALWGILLPLIFYLIWFFIISATVPFGDSVPETANVLTTRTLAEAKVFGQPATIPLAHLIGGQILIVASLFALFSTFTSFLGFGISLEDSYIDFSMGRIKKKLAIALTVLPPLFLAFWHPTAFLYSLDIAGLYGAGIFVGILPALLVLKSRSQSEREPEFVAPGGKILPISIFLFFLFGLIYKTYNLLL